MKTLVIAEKPSVATDLARVLKVPKKGDLYENETHVITSAVGHLVELEMPEDMDPKLRYWRLETLPIIPEKFTLKASTKTKDRFQLLKKLLTRPDITTAVNACDAGREGELIFAYIYQLAKAKVPVRRAWMQTMTADGIRAAFAALRPASEMAGLEAAARCRSESDWLIGLNGTRALTKRMFGGRAGNVATVGRVQTPTLAIVAARDAEIRDFQPRDYHRVTATFQIDAGTYEGTFQRPDFKKGADEHDRADRLWHKPTAQAIAAAAKASTSAEVSDEKKAATQASPRLYDLTTLQREANSRLGLPARRTLQIAQALYERHKVITYPRTDSRALPEDYIATCKETLSKLDHGDLATHATHALAANYVRPNKRIFNNAQISDHFAIIPTGSSADKLDDIEAKIYDMIARRFVAVFYPPAEFDVTTRTSTITIDTAIQARFAPSLPDNNTPPPPVALRSLSFKSEGKVLVSPGWLAVYGKTALEDAEEPAARKDKDASPSSNKSLPPLSAADGHPPRARTAGVSLHEESTKPPPRYTEATLLSAMEGAGKLVDDEELADAMKERGLGTPATRAEIIEGLLYQNYLERGAKRELQTTTKAHTLLEFLSALQADALTKPDMTAQWEYKLRQMEHGLYTRPEFMKEIADVTRGLVERAKTFEEGAPGTTSITDIPSPTDGQPLTETLRSYKSQDGKLTIYKNISERKITQDEVRSLLRDGELGPLEGFTSRFGKKFSAKLLLADDPKKPGTKKVELDYGNKVDHATATPFWRSDDSKQELINSPTGYILRQPQKDGTYKELFKISRQLCQKEITELHAIALAIEGRTPLIQGFISKKGKPFDATLLRQGPRIAWEFPPRAPKDPSGEAGGKNSGGAKTGRGLRAAVKHDLVSAESHGVAKLYPNGALLYQTPTHYVVTTPPVDPGAPQPPPYFQQPSTLCGLPLPPEQMQRLVNEGRTDLLAGLVSPKTGREFSAFLVLSKDRKKAEFEFPPRN
ncbi:MAG: topoisomerase C-terminal repeat-containing protein [Puniceicoccales bacterium]|nr:topoisomerase C-terminal repeat-containing protein [Puniceicoccales bacterium]